MATDDSRYDLDALATLCNLPRRTIRYYIQLGLVDRPVGETRAAYYTWQHLGRLLEIRKLTEQGISLERVGDLLTNPDTNLPPPVRPRPGSIAVRSHLHIADGIELAIDPEVANLSSEQLRHLAREIVTVTQHVLKVEEQ